MAPLLAEGEYQPAQYPKEGGILEVDFRGLAQTADRSSIPNRDPKHSSGGKRKRDDDEGAADMDADAPALPSGEPGPKRRAFNNVSGKARFTRASAAGAAVRPPTDWERKMKEKAQRKALQEHVQSVRDEAKDKAKAERKRRDEVATRREANRQAALKTQEITNPKTLKKLSKKKAALVWAQQKLGVGPAKPAAPPAAGGGKKKGGKKKGGN